MRLCLMIGIIAYAFDGSGAPTANVTVVGCIVDTVGADTLALDGARVRISGQTANHPADSTGFFRISMPSDGRPATIEAGRIGYSWTPRTVILETRGVTKVPAFFLTPNPDPGQMSPPLPPADAQRMRRRDMARFRMCQETVAAFVAPAP
jgi:hypothetical protein